MDGISEAAVCEPLKKGEKRETNVPTHWKFEEKKSNDRVVIQADIKLGEQSIGNLPVISFLLRISIKNWKVLIKYIAFQKEF